MKTKGKSKTTKCIKDPITLKKQYEIVLEHWPVPMEKIYIPNSLGQTLCIKSGDDANPPMVLIHGSLSNSGTWMGDIKSFNDKYSTYCLDIPGDPGGSEDRRFSWDGSNFSQWIKECMDGLGVDKAVIGGLSLGGWASLRFAIDCPERVSKLFLLAPAGLAPLKTLHIFKLLTLSFMGKWGRDKILEMLFAGREVTEEGRAFFEITAKNCRARMGNPPIFTDEELNSINVPVVFIGGAHDILVDTKASIGRMSQHIKNLKSLVLDEGHALVGLDKKVFELLG